MGWDDGSHSLELTVDSQYRSWNYFLEIVLHLKTQRETNILKGFSKLFPPSCLYFWPGDGGGGGGGW